MKDYGSATGLPKQTKSLCPECGKLLPATIYGKDGKVFIKKTCPDHGDFDDVYWSNEELYLRAEKFAHDGIGLKNPSDPTLAEGENVHVFVDGERVDMLTATPLANLDLTNRCNMQCPICFADANSAGYVYEPDFDTVKKMLDTLRNLEPIKCTAVQFSGGEPTIYPQIVEAIRYAKQIGFAQVQVATNGIEYAKNYEKLKACAQAGLNTLYLSFDGTEDEIYIMARARKMFKVKLDVLANLRKLKQETGHCPSVVLVCTLVRGVNDHNVGKILDFAFDNADVIRGVNFQPVAFTGRVGKDEVEHGRITLPDLAKCVEEQTDYAKVKDWYPVPVVAPISNFVSILLGHTKVTFTAHPHCGLATYVFVDDKGKAVPFPEFIDVDKLSRELTELTFKMEHARFKKLYALKLLKLLDRSIIEEKIPGGLTKRQFIGMIRGVMSNDSKKQLAAFSWKMMYIGAMHFQDSYNYDIERVRRCAVHYVTPDCRVIPFCAYNSGPDYRVEVEKKFSMPLAEWKAKNKKGAEELEAALIVPEDQRPDAP